MNANERFLEHHFGVKPSGWTVRRLGDFFTERTELSSDMQKFPLHSFTIENGVTEKTDRYERSFLLKDADNNQFKVVHPKDFVINPMNLRFGAVGKSEKSAPVTVSAYYDVLYLKDTEIDPDYLLEVLRSPNMLNIYDRVAIGSLLEKKRVHLSMFENLNVFIPPKTELHFIASVARSSRDSEVLLERLVAAKRELKRGLVHQLLVGVIRFKEFNGQRRRKLHLGDVISYTPRITKKPSGGFLAAGIRSHGKGVFLKPDFEADDIALEELFLLRTDDLVVNITFGWEGAVAIVPPEADGALVSHRFPTFTFKQGVSFPGYFRHVIRQKRFIHEMGLASPGGAGRNRVLDKADFLKIPVELPLFEEQQRIAEVLNACDREIELLEKQLEALKEQKRGLMQKLLTGEVRVKV